MKLKLTFSLLAVAVFSQVSSPLVQAKKNFIERHDQHSNNDDPTSSKAPQSSLRTNLYEQPPTLVETVAVASIPVEVPSASSSTFSSYSFLHRDLKKDSSKYFFFEQCSDTCAENGGVATRLDDDCCAGGVSFLKMKFHAQDQIYGTIALGSPQSAFCGQGSGGQGSGDGFNSKATKAGGGRALKGPSSSRSSSNVEHRFVECNATCIQEPFGGHSCDEDSVLNEKTVEPGSEICLAMIKSDTNNTYEVAYDEKMPTNLNVLFLSGEGFSVGTIHTSCSVPLSQPWGVRLKDPCDKSSSGSGKKRHSRGKHINTTDYIGDSTPYLSFIDGISTKYFLAVDQVLREPDTVSYVQEFSIGFNDCGCTCERSNATSIPGSGVTPSLTPSNGPSKSPTSVPTLVPSLPPTKDPTPSPTIDPSSIPTEETTANPSLNPSSAPTEASTSTETSSSTPSDGSRSNPDPGAPTGSACNPGCAAFIEQHCVFVGTNQACNVNFPIPVITEDDEEEGAEAGTIPPSVERPEPHYTGNFGKGTKGFGKSGNKGGKGAKGKDGKGSKGAKYFSKSGYERHLQKIEYHQSRIDYLEKLLMRTGV